ncbi:SRSO17 transposase [Kineococcus xinjiangensis]|uniref:SRSO17 transposase n=1 Tax=Kineococcus xinjiangensis TaxID=512762 RepID=A0A2S6IV75_9ACTN|nr:transposase [Kineococcus xinjiangensis]PPK98053.1 SRSO17 transposase [Kineococcus xinjiangensis]
MVEVGDSPRLPDMYEDVLEEVCGYVFAALPREDQRRAGREYVRGLILTSGRKTVRGMVTCKAAASAREQRLHHFVSRSTWSSREVRQRLMDFLLNVSRLSAWIVQPTVLKKSGVHTVGVKNEVVPCLGKQINHQHVLASWYVGDDLMAPVDWRLVLPSEWTQDAARRRRAGIPQHVDSETPTQSAVGLIRALPPGTASTSAPPVLMDTRETHTPAILSTAVERGMPYLLRVPGSLSLTVHDGHCALPKGFAGRAQRLAQAARPAGWAVAGLPDRRVLRLPVVVDDAHGASRQTRLFADWSGDKGWAKLWVTDLEVDDTQILRLAAHLELAERTYEHVSRSLGATDYEGRSYVGWHHHMSLVSIAQAVQALAAGAPVTARPEAQGIAP